MSKTNNEKTIENYNVYAENYKALQSRSVNSETQQWLKQTLHGASKQAKILEIGSGLGFDADFIESLGYVVERTDATEEFVTYIQEQGRQARVLNILTEDVLQRYDIVLAKAVLLHFTREESALVCKKIYTLLNDGGRFSLSVKEGEGDEWTTDKTDAPRYMRYWQEKDMKDLLLSSGFKRVETIRIQSSRPGIAWLAFIAHK